LWALADLLFLRFLSRSSQLPRFHFTESRLTFSFVPNRDAWFSPPNVFPDFHFLGFSAARFFVRLGARSDPTARRAPVLSSRSILGSCCEARRPGAAVSGSGRSPEFGSALGPYRPLKRLLPRQRFSCRCAAVLCSRFSSACTVFWLPGPGFLFAQPVLRVDF
jgi:hypothetical protein